MEHPFELNSFVEYIKKNPETAFQLLCQNGSHLIHDTAEQVILQDPKYCYRFAEEVLKSRWKKAEFVLAKDIYFSYNYAKNVIQGRFQIAENLISKDPEYALNYVEFILKKRWPKAEEAISKHASFSYKYAKFLKNRFRKGEESISNDAAYSYYYAQNIIKGKLPAKMHDKMLGHALDDPENEFVKKYFEFISKNS